MVDHAFGTLGLHRIALYVFEFNERAIRAYQRCGFVIEGRSRESIWRDGRWWDELAMSILESDWRAAGGVRAAGPSVVASGTGTGADDAEEPVGAGPSDRFRRTIGRWR
jgi:hypothetical protein